MTSKKQTLLESIRDYSISYRKAILVYGAHSPQEERDLYRLADALAEVSKSSTIFMNMRYKWEDLEN